LLRTKRIIFDVGHPGQVHQFKNLYWLLEGKGWDCLFVAKNKEFTIELLTNYKLKYELIGGNRVGLLKKIINIPREYIKFYRIVRKFKPSIVLNRFAIYSSHISWLFRIPVLAFSDTEHASFFHKFTLPFIKYKFTGKTYFKSLGKNHLRFNSSIELFYLHPNYFIPSKESVEKHGIDTNSNYFILRFVSWNAHHDIGEKGLSVADKKQLVSFLSKHGRVLISSEQSLPFELERYKIHIPPENILDVMAYSSLYIGEGGTMASEAALVGTQSIYINNLDAGIFQEEAKSDILYSFRNKSGVYEKVVDVITNQYLKERFLKSRDKFISSKIDVTALMVWFIENYPESAKIMKENPDYQYNFK
jgi:uncharacterized protein